MRTTLKLGAVAVALALVMTGCGDDDDGGSTSEVDVKTERGLRDPHPGGPGRR